FTVIEKEFAPFEEFAVYCSDDTEEEKVPSREWVKYKTFDQFDYELAEDNMLVLDKAKVFVDGKFFTEDYVLTADGKLRTEFGLEIRHGQMIQPWFKEKFGLTDDNKRCRIRLEYPFNVEYIPEKLKYMYESADGLALFMNGERISTENSTATPIDNCFTVTEIPCELIKKGDNVLAVELDFYERTNIEGGFLCGKFGVKLGEKDTLTELPKTIRAGDLRKQGLPYFGGRIRFSADIENGEYLVETDDMRLSAINVNGKTLAFKPLRAEITVSNGKIDGEMVLNRNNCFGADGLCDIKKKLIEQGFEKITISKSR
ncbi:MAG: hypothetical protein J5911_05865, partial [Clostridia bacterium]|nr:hypothetical protein [Clostridia bacterium]